MDENHLCKNEVFLLTYTSKINNLIIFINVINIFD